MKNEVNQEKELYLVEYFMESLHSYECDEQFVIAVCSNLNKAMEFKKEFQNQWGRGVRIRKIRLNEAIDDWSQLICKA